MAINKSILFNSLLFLSGLCSAQTTKLFFEYNVNVLWQYNYLDVGNFTKEGINKYYQLKPPVGVTIPLKLGITHNKNVISISREGSTYGVRGKYKINPDLLHGTGGGMEALSSQNVWRFNYACNLKTFKRFTIAPKTSILYNRRSPRFSPNVLGWGHVGEDSYRINLIEFNTDSFNYHTFRLNLGVDLLFAINKNASIGIGTEYYFPGKRAIFERRLTIEERGTGAIKNFTEINRGRAFGLSVVYRYHFLDIEKLKKRREKGKESNK